MSKDNCLVLWFSLFCSTKVWTPARGAIYVQGHFLASVFVLVTLVKEMCVPLAPIWQQMGLRCLLFLGNRNGKGVS